ncbi:MAG: hypothetical protein LC122_00685 [Chitinophagales bacterium]|nr:hypothetical protein [Chitinophagales bacterium]
MNYNKIIQEELKEVSSVIAALTKNNIYNIPDNYFINFPQQIISVVKANSTLLSKGYETPFNIPNGYFTEFPQKILNLATNQQSSNSEIDNELNEVAPLLNTISKKQVYSVPENYFDKIEINKTISNNHSERKRIKRWMQYAVAAVFASIALVSSINFMKNLNTLNLQKEFAKTTDDELNDYLKTNNTVSYASLNEEDNIADLFQGLDTDELIFY